MEIRNLEHTDFDTLFHCFEKAFADYEISFEREEVFSMLNRRGYNPCLSFAAFVNEEIVAFTLNGTGTFNGISTAYDTGTGTVKEYRGEGIAGKIFTHSLPFLKQARISQYLLEVLRNNQKAINVYQRMNFETTREFDCFRQSIEQIDNRNLNPDCIITPIDTDSIREAQGWCDFNPSWQNSIESIERGISGLTCLGAFHGQKLIGYCVSDVCTGDLSQIAVHPDYRCNGVGSRLLHEAILRMKSGFIKVLNVSSDNTTLSNFLKHRNIPLASKQFEMVLPL